MLPFDPFLGPGGGGRISRKRYPSMSKPRGQRPSQSSRYDSSTPAPPEGGSSGGLSEAFRKGVRVKRWVFVFLFVAVLCAGHPSDAAPARPATTPDGTIVQLDPSDVSVACHRGTYNFETHTWEAHKDTLVHDGAPEPCPRSHNLIGHPSSPLAVSPKAAQ